MLCSILGFINRKVRNTQIFQPDYCYQCLVLLASPEKVVTKIFCELEKSVRNLIGSHIWSSFVYVSILVFISRLLLTHQRLQLFVVRQVELSDKVIEMLVAGIDMSLGPHLAHTVKVVNVDVDKHPEQTRQNLLSHLHEGLREGSTWESNRWRQKSTTVSPAWAFSVCSRVHFNVFNEVVMEYFSHPLIIKLFFSPGSVQAEWGNPPHFFCDGKSTQLCLRDKPQPRLSDLSSMSFLFD